MNYKIYHLRVSLTIGSIACLIAILYFSNATETNTIINDIFSAQATSRFLTPDHSGHHLAFIRAVAKGRSLFLTELQTRATKQLATKGEVDTIYPWSADDRYLVFSQIIPDPNINDLKPHSTFGTFLYVYDSRNKSIRKLTASERAIEEKFMWVDTNKFYFLDASLDNNSCHSIVAEISDHIPTKTTNDSIVDDLIISMDYVSCSNNVMAYVKNGNIYQWTMEATNLSPDNPITYFKSSSFDYIHWLRYCKQTGCFLFCSRTNRSNWRYLYKYSCRDKIVSQLTAVDTYNGQWFEGGEAYAYIWNTNNHFILSIRGHPQIETNLFVNGSVNNYTVSPSGSKVYFTGSRSIEPQSIWEYDIDAKTLRPIVEGLLKPFKLASVVHPVELSVAVSNKLNISVFLFPPVAKHAGHSKKKPFVIYLPPTSAQMQAAFETRSQLYANLGFYFIAVNYRGCDGYGKEFAERKNASKAMYDVMAVYQEIIQTLDVDTNNCFLYSHSDGVDVSQKLVAAFPFLWKGVIWEHPSNIPEDDFFEAHIPPLFISSGDREAGMERINHLQELSDIHGYPIKFQFDKESGHINWRMDNSYETQKTMVHFLRDQLH